MNPARVYNSFLSLPTIQGGTPTFRDGNFGDRDCTCLSNDNPTQAECLARFRFAHLSIIGMLLVSPDTRA